MKIIQIPNNVDESIIQYCSYRYESPITNSHLDFLKVLKAIKTGFKLGYSVFIVSNINFNLTFIKKISEYIRNVDCILITDSENIVLGYVLNRETAIYILRHFDLLFKDIKSVIDVQSMYTDLNYINVLYTAD